MRRLLTLTILPILILSCGKEDSPTPSKNLGDAFYYYNDFLNAGIPSKPLQEALAFYEDNQMMIKNKKYISIADYSQSSKEKRFYLLDMETGKVQIEQVSHGSGAVRTKYGLVKYGDPDHDGYLDRCKHYSSAAAHPYQNMTRAGFMLTAHTYKSVKDWPKIGISNHNAMKLMGLEQRNSDAMKNGVVFHEADYNTEGKLMGRSWGCPAFVPGKGGPIMRKIKGGSLYYSYAPQCD